MPVLSSMDDASVIENVMRLIGGERSLVGSIKGLARADSLVVHLLNELGTVGICPEVHDCAVTTIDRDGLEHLPSGNS